MRPRWPTRIWQTTAVLLLAVVVPGCAGLRCPRIDPSGERIFVWPDQQVAPVAAPTNPGVPPVFTDPVFPQPPLPGNQPVGGLVPPVPRDHLTLTPGRVLAPVGSEVILRAGLCTRENFLLTDSKIEWLLAREQVGEFVELGGRGWCKDPWLPWNRPKKIDNQYAVGYTAKVPLSITRGTANTTDDVQIQPGESWASITSPVEGTTRVTAVAPEIAEWSQRRATATIHWVDVQWTFPAANVTAGGGQVLTTTVLRQTDNTPIEGWLVRYEVADGSGAIRSDQSGQAVEVPTDAQGRASIDVTPTGSAGSTTRINIQLVRPAGFGGTSSPRLVIASGSTVVNWTDGGSDYVPPPDDLGPPTTTPAPFPGTGNTPPIQPTPARIGPRLELEVFETSNQQILVGSEIRFELVMRNTGDTTATDIIVTDAFDAGLTHPSAGPGQFEIKTDPGKVTNIAAGDQRSVFLTFGVNKSGRLCQNFTVTHSGGQVARQTKCIVVAEPQVQPQGRLQVRLEGPRQRMVGEPSTFRLSITNVGEGPLTNLVVENTFDPELRAETAQDAELRGNSLFWQLPRLEVGQNWRRDITCQCLTEKRSACGVVNVTADTGPSTSTTSQADRACIEILQRAADVIPPVNPGNQGAVTPNVNPPGAGPANPTGGLGLELTSFANPVTAGTRATFQVVIRNTTATTSDQQVQLRVVFPPEITPDVQAIQTGEGNLQRQFQNQELLFEPINELRPNENVGFTIPCYVQQAGVRNVTAQVVSRNVPQPIQRTIEIEILGR